MKRNRPYPHYKYPDEIVIAVKPLTENECNWFNVPVGSFELRCSNYGWFPTDVLMTVEKGKYVDGYHIGAIISGNMGTASIAVKDVTAAKELLTYKGYNIQ